MAEKPPLPLDGEKTPDGDKPPPDLRLLRWGLIACQALTILVTWPLWESRIDHPWMPHLPAIPENIAWVFQFNWAWPLLASLLWAAIHAPSGIIVHAICLSLSILADQLRLQPEFVSLLILMAGTLPNRALQVVARYHLAALWFFAGFHKLLSADFWNEAGAAHLQRTFSALDHDAAQFLAVSSAIAELAVGVLWLIPKTRLLASVTALLLHFGILASLILQKWNVAVWPWNIALMMAAILFAVDWDEPAHESAAKSGWPGMIGAALMLASPLLFYVGYFDSYLCHCLYSGNTASATHFSGPDDATGRVLTYRAVEMIYVPFPPEHRLYEQYFRKVAKPGDMLLIRDRRWYYHYRGWGERWFEKPLEGGPDGFVIEISPAEVAAPSEPPDNSGESSK